MSNSEVDPYEDMLGEIYCLTFVRGVDETEALLRMGGLRDTMRPRALAQVGGEMYSFDAGYPTIAQAMSLGAWSVVIEPGGFEGADAQLLGAVSQGTEAVSVLRHDYASDFFGHAVDATLLTGFDPAWPARRWGAEPDRLVEAMRAAGFDPGDDDMTDYGLRHAVALRLARRITGVLPRIISDELLPSAHIEPWFSAAEPSTVHRPPQNELADALDAAAAPLRRAVAVREVRHVAERAGVAHLPEVAEALAAAERGDDVDAADDSQLGRRLRTWLADSRRAGNSLNDHHARHRMGDDERSRAFRLGWLAEALRGALWPDSPMAAYEALRPLTDGPFAVPSRRTTVLRVLRGEEPPDHL